MSEKLKYYNQLYFELQFFDLILLNGPFFTIPWVPFLSLLLASLELWIKSNGAMFPTDPKGRVVEAVCLFLDLFFLLLSLTYMSSYTSCSCFLTFLLDPVTVLSLAICWCAICVGLSLSLTLSLLLADFNSLEYEIFFNSLDRLIVLL